MTRRSRTRSVADPAALPAPPPIVEGLELGSAAVQRPMEWYLPGALPSGSLCLLEGRKSSGKSTIAAAIVACVQGGPVIPGWTGPRDGRAIWAGGEEQWECEILPRIAAAGGDPGAVYRIRLRDGRGQPRRCVLPDDCVILQDAIREAGARVLILDPYISLCHPSLDMRIEQQARIYLETLAGCLAASACLGVCIRHIRKGTSGDARDAGLGSVGVGNTARSVIRCDEHPHLRDHYTMCVVALNGGRRLPTQVYRIPELPTGGVRIEWVGACDLDADAIAEGRGSEADRGEWHDADRILYSLIGDGRCAVAELRKEALVAGVSERMLRRAGERLRVTKHRISHANTGWWEWGTPAAGWPPGLAETGGNGQGAQGAASPRVPPELFETTVSNGFEGAHVGAGPLGPLPAPRRRRRKGGETSGT